MGVSSGDLSLAALVKAPQCTAQSAILPLLTHSLRLLTSADGALLLVSGAEMLVSGALGFDIDYRFVTVVPGAS